MRAWWENRSVRERRLIAVAGALAAGLLLWLSLVRPLGAALNEAERRQQDMAEMHGAVAARVALLRHGNPMTAVPSAPGEWLAASAAEEGFAADPPRPLVDGRWAVRIASARAGALMGWIARIEARGGRAESLRISPQGSGTVALEAVFRFSRGGA